MAAIIQVMTEDLRNKDVLRSKAFEALAALPRDQRRELIVEQFTSEFGPTLSPGFQEELKSLTGAAMLPEQATVEKADQNETPEQKADRLLKSIIRAEFDSFQEYGYISTRSNKGFNCIKQNFRVSDLDREYDIIKYSPNFSKFSKTRSVLIGLTIAQLIDPALVGSDRLKSVGDLLCVIDVINGKTIVQGGGQIHPDQSERQGGNPSSFKLVFDTKDAADEYINWLQTSPNIALNTVLKTAIGDYDEQGNFRQTLLPSNPGPDRRSFHDPFLTPIAKVLVKDFRQM